MKISSQRETHGCFQYQEKESVCFTKDNYKTKYDKTTRECQLQRFIHQRHTGVNTE